MKTILSVLIAVLGLSFSAHAKNPKANPVPQMVLFDAEAVLKMNDLQRERYFEALRDYMDEAQAKDPTFAEYLMDTLLGSSVAEAQFGIFNTGAPAWKKKADRCNKEIAAHEMESADCWEEFEAAIKRGWLRDCQKNQVDNSDGSITIRCTQDTGGNNYLNLSKNFVGDSSGREKLEKTLQTPNPLSKNDAAAGSGGLAGAAPTTVTNDGGKPADDKDKEKGKKEDEKKKDGPARCFYAGFLIQVDKDAKKNKCEPVSDYCADNTRSLPWDPQIKNLDICKGDKSGGKCPSTDDKKSTVKSKGPKSKEESVVCNPALYGTDLKDKKEQVICVARSGDASSKCRAKAQVIADKDKEGYKKRLEAQLKGNALGFDKFVRGLAANCNYRFKMNYNADKGSLDDMKDIDDKEIDGQLTENEKAGGWSKTGRTDFKKTCQVLLKRTAEVGMSASGDQKKSITEILKGAPAGGTR